jgi:tetratricopeptide (TPR) repeat protein
MDIFLLIVVLFFCIQSVLSKRLIRFLKILVIVVFLWIVCLPLLPAEAYTKLSPQWYASLAQEEARKGDTFHDEGEYLMAYEAYTKAIGYCPVGTATASWYNNLGLNYVAMKQPALAAASFQTAIRLHPMNAVYYENLVRVYSSDDQAKVRLKTLVDYVAYNPPHADAWFLLGLFYNALGEERGMQTAWRQHLSLAPRSPFRAKICRESPEACVPKK